VYSFGIHSAVPSDADPLVHDVVIVGAGAAGLATAIFLREADASQSVCLLDSARAPGAKILISGGTRCNVTNRVVSERDFWGGRGSIVRRILRGFTPDETVAFFRARGVPLHEEADGKLFPDSGRARDVLTALLRGASDAGAHLRSNHRVLEIERNSAGFLVETSRGRLRCTRLVLATGGQSLPKTGSDGTGFRFATGLGHTIVPTTPALAPLVLDQTSGGALNRSLSGVSHDAELTVWVEGRRGSRLRGSLLWTHFGISGPVALNASRHWLRAEAEGRVVHVTVNFCPDTTFDTLENRWIGLAATRPKASIATALAEVVPASVATAILEQLAIDSARPLGQLTRAERRALVRGLLELPIQVMGSRGYNFAEATAGGVALDEIDPATMASRRCPGLYLVGEMLDVDGRIGGFNFQWAWATAYLAARGLAALPKGASAP